MSKILVYDVAAESGGARTICNQFYKYFSKDKKNEYIFVLSVLQYQEMDNIKIISLPWVKKSWIHRMFCDIYYLKRIAKKYDIDEVVSLQNIGVNIPGKKSTVYCQNVIPFCRLSFNPLLEPILWLNKVIIGRLTINSLKSADRVIVQTNWMKKRIEEKVGINSSAITVFPVISDNIKGNIEKHVLPQTSSSMNCFFYPASAFSFKNHMIVIKACQKLKCISTKSFTVVFTINENENKLTKKITKKIRKYDLPIKMIGCINKELMEDYYKKSILLFPSLLETVGLPILEAQEYGATELLADLEYAKETAGQYSKAYWFNPKDDTELASLMDSVIS